MRKISNSLLARLTNADGDRAKLLAYVKSDPELRLEVRRGGEAFIYYRRGKALELGSLKADKKYGDLPPGSLAVDSPAEYFDKMKAVIDDWLKDNKLRAEFDTQQNIARHNGKASGRYVIIDMEYAFEQHQIGTADREKKAVFDLLGIDAMTGRVIFFEVKTGTGSLKGKSGIDSHIQDFERFIKGKNAKLFLANLMQDVENILADKLKLGLLPALNFSRELEPELIFVFHSKASLDLWNFERELKLRKELILVEDHDYQLR